MARRSAVLVSILFLTALPLAAQTDFGAWLTRVSSSTTHTDGGDIRFDSGTGYGISIAHRFASRFSLEAAAYELHRNGHVDLAGVDALNVGRLHMRPITLAVQWHLAHGAALDPYVGIGGAYVKTDNLSSDELEQNGIGTVEVKSGFAPMANAGASFAVGHNLAVGVDVKYVRFHSDSGPDTARVRLELDPVIASAGLRFRF